MMVIAIVALLVFGPKKLPEVGKQLGQAMREFHKIRDELMGTVHSVREEMESAYEPIAKPYSQSHPVSSPTVEAVTTRRVYDQEPEDLMAPVVPALHAEEHTTAVPEDGKLLVPPPPVGPSLVSGAAHEKGE